MTAARCNTNHKGLGAPATCVVVGATGGIGGALANALAQAGQGVVRLGRATDPRLELLDEASIAAAAAFVGPGLRLVIDATGVLHDARSQPEKSWRHLDPAQLAHQFAINAIGPALLMKHFLPLLARNERAVFATLSARVGSISDNHLGGWYGYRASKAALNQLVRTAAIELARTRPLAICVALHPGTVDTDLSRPFAKAGLAVRTPEEAAERLLGVIAGLTVAQTGLLVDYNGKVIAF
jgi:NAD(P)-dependent dehydrogenase (short-subunit alcohol dehydrogenase family)